MIICTRNASDRIRGYLSSVMLEIDSGVYITNVESPVVRQNIWGTVLDWSSPELFAVMIFKSKSSPGGIALETLGTSPISLKDVDGLVLTRRT
jgi:CRISPR-associated protein Cas2